MGGRNVLPLPFHRGLSNYTYMGKRTFKIRSVQNVTEAEQREHFCVVVGTLRPQEGGWRSDRCGWGNAHLLASLWRQCLAPLASRKAMFRLHWHPGRQCFGSMGGHCRMTLIESWSQDTSVSTQRLSTDSHGHPVLENCHTSEFTVWNDRGSQWLEFQDWFISFVLLCPPQVAPRMS